MSSLRLVRAGGIAAVLGAIALIVEGVLTLTNRRLGTVGDIVVLAGLVLVAFGVLALCAGLLQVEPGEPGDVGSDS